MPAARTVLSITGAWLAAALIAVWAGVFSADGPPLAMAVAVAVPPFVVLGLLAGSPAFQAWARSLDLRFLVTLQMWRIAGFAILAAWGVGALPGGFALPAGYGDVLVAVLAPFVVYAIGRPQGRTAFRAWTAMGIADLIVAVALGLLHSPGVEVLTGGPTTAAMGELPLAIIPAFGVPLMMSVHIVSLYTARFAAETAPVPALARHA
ncbi:MAG: hypothetical protein ACRDQB_12305 [Thermocrispum sp.]